MMRSVSEARSAPTFSVASLIFCFLRGAAGLLGSLGSRGFRVFLGLSSTMGVPSGPSSGSFFLRCRLGFSGAEAVPDFDASL